MSLNFLFVKISTQMNVKIGSNNVSASHLEPTSDGTELKKLYKFILFYKRNMKPLPTNQKILTWLFLLPANRTINQRIKWTCIALLLALIVASVAIFVSGLMFVIKFMSIDFIQASFGLTPTCANTIVVVFFSRHKVPPIFEKLTKLYEKCMNQFKNI